MSANLNKFERARIIGARAIQLAFGAPPLIEVGTENSSIEVAMKELEAGIIPLVVLRPSYQ
jgi:DNA-directed RNA polymerase subunit K/omega